MADIPALEKTWWTRANIPFPDTTTAANVCKSWFFNLKNVLINATTTGTASTTTGTRAAASVWSVVSSSNGTTASAGDLWGTTFDSTKLVQAASTSAHSWIILQNSNLGYQMLIDLNSATTTYGRICFTKTSDPFVVAGTPTQSPSAPSEGWIAGTTVNTTSQNAVIISDTTSGTSHYSHISVASTGEFYFLTSRISTGIFNSFIGFVKFSDGPAGDTRNYVTVFQSGGSTRGVPEALTSLALGMRRTPNGSLLTLGGIQSVQTMGGTSMAAYPIDNVSNKYNVFPNNHMCLAPQVAWSGRIPDMYYIHAAPNVSSIPSAAAQTRILASQQILPMIDVVPLT